jgi:hypothetical protein
VKYNIIFLIKARGFKNCSILSCGLFPIGTPLSWDFNYRFFVIFDLIIFSLLCIVNKKEDMSMFNKENESKDGEGNQYKAVLSSELRSEFNLLKDEYKAARKSSKTVAERKLIMQAYADDVIDLAIEARLAGEHELNRELNQLVDSLQRRTWSGKRSW